MKTNLEINVIFHVINGLQDEITYKVIIQHNRENKSYNVFFGLVKASGYNDMLEKCTNKVLHYLNAKKDDFSTIHINDVNFNF